MAKQIKLLELQDRYYHSIKRFVFFHIKDQWVAEDIVQETFLKAYRNFSTLKDTSKAKTWLFTIAWNLCLNYFKKKRIDPRSSSDYMNINPSLVNIQQQVEQHEMEDCIHKKIEQLPDALKQVLSLYDLEGFSHNEIGDILGISTGSAKTRLHRARKALRAILEKECSFQRDRRNIFICIPKEFVVRAK